MRYLIYFFIFSSTLLSMEKNLDETKQDSDEYHQLVTKSLKRKRIIEERITPVKRQKNEKINSVSYFDVTPRHVEVAQCELDKLSGKMSYTKSYSLYGDGSQESALTNLEELGLGNFVKLFNEVIETIKEMEKPNNRVPLHIAVRIDPEAINMKIDFERKLTSQWHKHGDDDRYIFVIATDHRLATEIKIKDEQLFIDRNRIFFLPGPMEHRTPEPVPGKRIQISISVAAL